MRLAIGLAAAAVMGTQAFAADLNHVYKPTYSPPMQNVVAHLEVGVGLLSINYESDNETVGAYFGAGRLNKPLGNGLNFLVDLSTSGVFEDGEGYSGHTVTGHLWKSYGSHVLGVFGGTAYAGFVPVILGVEAEKYIDSNAWGGQLAVALHDDISLFTARGWLKHYFHQNFKGEVEVGIVSAHGGSEDDTGFMLAGTLEHRHEGQAFSKFLRGEVLSFDEGHVFTGLVGVRLFSDTPGTTLYQHDMQTPFKYSLPLAQGGASCGLACT